MQKSTRLAWLLWCASLVFYLYMAAVKMPAAAKDMAAASEDNSCAQILDLNIVGFAADEVYKSFTCMGEAGRKQYFRIQTSTDIIYPVSYGLFFAVTAYFLVLYTTRKSRLALFFALVAVLGMLMDFYENHNIAQLLLQYPNLDSSVVQLASIGNTFKWIFAFVGMGSIVIFGIWALVKKLKKQ